MYRRVATLIAVASATAAIGLAEPDAHADPQTDNQRFLDIVRRHGVGGQDETLLKYAGEFCTNKTGVQLPSRPELYGQGVRPDQFYIINEAASRVYCFGRVAVPSWK
jgi:hypothetical protein